MPEGFEEEQKEETKIEMEKLQQDVKPANKKVIIFNFALIVVIFVGLFIYMINVDGMDNIVQILHQVDYKWVTAGLVCLVIHWLCEASNLHTPLKKCIRIKSLLIHLKYLC